MNDFRLNQPQTARLPRLLHMEYTLQELSEELDCEVRHLRHAIAVGCPHRNTKQTIFIVGDEFRTWYELHRNARKVGLGDGEFYCLKCRAKVRPDQATITSTEQERRSVVHQRGVCPKCGTIVNKFAKTAGTETAEVEQ